jgi:hypothetical protein
MLTITKCSKENDASTLLSIAKGTLSHLPNLSRIFDNFSMFPTFSYQNPNPILSHCARQDQSAKIYLDKIESGLSNLIINGKLKVDNAGRLDVRFINRITSTTPSEYLPVLSEIRLADYLLNLFGKKQFFYEEGPKKAKKADFKIDLPNRKFHLELRTLMKVTTKQSIENIFEQVCIGIVNIVKSHGGSRNLLFRLDTARLPVDDEHHIDINKSVQFLITSFSKLNLLALVDTGIKIDFHKISQIYFPKESLDLKASQVLKREDFGAVFEYDKNDTNIENQIGQWLDTISTKDLQHCVFDLFQVTNNEDDNCVSISPIDINLEDPNISVPGTSASRMDKQSFIDQIQRAIADKCKSGQRVPGEPSILILDTWDWRFNYFEFESFVELKIIIMEELRKCKSISGLILFHEIIIAGKAYGFHDGRYIENDACDSNIRVTEKELQSLSILKEHDDPKILFEISNDGEIIFDTSLEKIQHLIEIQPTITLHDDKINLLSTIEIFLLNPHIEANILKSLNEIVTEYCHDSDPTGTQAGISSEPPDASISSSVPAVRSIATSCIFKLLKHVASYENIQLAISLHGDKNTLVRESTIKNLPFLYKIDPPKAITIAKKALTDNERVRRRLACTFFPYLFDVDRETCLDLCNEVVNIQNSSSVDRDETLQCAIHIICVGALKYDLSAYSDVLDKLVTNSTLKGKVKEYVASSCGRDDFLLDKSLSAKLIQIYHGLILNSPKQSRPKIGSRFLFGLVKNELSFFPEIRPLLETLLNEQYPEYSFDVEIIDYLLKFGLNFPEQATKYLKTITNVNSHLLTAPAYSQKIYTIVEKLLNAPGRQDSKNDLIYILEKMTEYDYINLNLPEAKELLKKVKDITRS